MHHDHDKAVFLLLLLFFVFRGSDGLLQDMAKRAMRGDNATKQNTQPHMPNGSKNVGNPSVQALTRNANAHPNHKE